MTRTGKRRLLWIVLASAAVFFTGLLVSSVWFHRSRDLDWTALIISDLQSPEENPAGYGFSAAATAASGLLLLPVARAFHNRLRPRGPVMTTAASVAFATGACGAVSIGLLAPFPVSYDLVHIPLAFATFIGIVAGLVLYLGVVVRSGSEASSPSANVLRVCLALATAVLMCLVYVYFVPDFFDGSTLLTTLALWEWTLCAGIMGLLVLLVVEVER